MTQLKKIITIVLSILLYNLSFAQESTLNEELSKLSQTLFYINNYYLDTVNNQKLTEEAIKSMLLTLDPHSSYVSAKDVKAMNEPLVGNFEGVGIEFSIIRDTLSVSATVAGGPSERVGIRAGDKIIAVDNENIASIGLTNEMVFKYLRGPKGSKVVLTVKRGADNTPLIFNVERDKIPINSVDAAYEIEPGVLYVKLGRFASSSSKEILSKVLALNINPIKGFILDLRGNSGGFLSTAMEISNFFLSQGQTIVYTEGMKVKRREERANGFGFYKEAPLAVLIDENSASASEIVAGAVQDWDRAQIIGRRSFGKGLVQQMLPLPDGSQLRLTIARYHTPSGRVIQSPYIEGQTQEYYKSFADRFKRGESFSQDSIHFSDSLKYRTLKKGRVVYGGGGIMPDVFIPADTTYYTEYYAQLLRKSILTDFINDYGDKNREQFKSKYKSIESFIENFNISQEFTDNLVKFASTKGVEQNSEEFERSRPQIELQIKALIARSLFGLDGYYKVVNNREEPFIKAALNYFYSFD